MKIKPLFFATLFIMASCGSPTAENAVAAAEPAEETQEAQSPAPTQVEKTAKGITQVRESRETIEMHEGRESQAATFKMDGSTESAFEESLKALQESAPTDEYRSVKSAIQYLLVYDLNTRGNKTKLYAKLDGKTPEEIIAMAKR